MFVTPKEVEQKTRLLDIVEAPHNSHIIAIPTNEPRIFSAYKYIENMNAKLTPRVSSSVGGQLAMNKPSMF